MRTPRVSSRPGRNFGTLIGNGWLRESPRNVLPREWDLKSRSALRKCMFIQMPPHIAELAAQLPAAPPDRLPPWQPPQPPRKDAGDAADVAPRARNPKMDVRMFAAVSPEVLRARAHAGREGTRNWWEDPIALGTLLIVCPPIGVACVWSSKAYSSDARWALTVMSVLVTCFGGAAALALLLT